MKNFFFKDQFVTSQKIPQENKSIIEEQKSVLEFSLRIIFTYCEYSVSSIICAKGVLGSVQVPYTDAERFFKYNWITRIDRIGKGDDQRKEKKKGGKATGAFEHDISSIQSGFPIV